jgi:DNA-directed RNA polymerase subunit RPC12/RpoP
MLGVETIVIVECQKCGKEIGTMQTLNGKEMLVVNDIAVTYMRGACIRCGKEFHWDIGTRGLSAMLMLEKDKS